MDRPPAALRALLRARALLERRPDLRLVRDARGLMREAAPPYARSQPEIAVSVSSVAATSFRVLAHASAVAAGVAK